MSGGTSGDQATITAQIQAIQLTPNTERELERAARYVRRAVPDPDAALTVLAALELADPYQPLPGQRAPGRVRGKRAKHGSRSGLEWHRKHGTALCGACRTWGDLNRMGAH